MHEFDPLIKEYEHDKARPREAEALKTLRKVASLVKPIMRQRGWTVSILTEFYPPEKNLLGLNWNRGQKICLRLRYPYDEKQFIPLEEVVDTMLHELCHIVHGPHDQAFNTLWNQLRDEQENLLRKGYTGEGFLSTGHKLGGGRIPMNEARRQARAAAERRRTLTAGSGQKLGGSAVRRGEDIRKVIADAATRRITVTKGCASGTERSKDLVDETSRNGFRTKAEEENANEEAIMQAYIEMIQEEEREKYGKDYVQVSNSNPAGSQGVTTSTFKPDQGSSSTPEGDGGRHISNTFNGGLGASSTFGPGRVPSLQTTARPVVPQDTKLQRSEEAYLKSSPDTWSCDICTLVNPVAYLSCDACGIERPANISFSSDPDPEARPVQMRADQTRPARYSGASTSSLSKHNRTLKAYSAFAAAESKKPLGWVCQRCGNFMENEWWTCAGCGTMKQSS